jgi:hypothetical protein
VTDHAEKAALFWHEFKNRLGVSVNTQMLYDFQQLMPVLVL